MGVWEESRSDWLFSFLEKRAGNEEDLLMVGGRRKITWKETD